MADGGSDERWRMGKIAMVVVTSEWAVLVVTSGRRDGDGGGGEEVKRDGLEEKEASHRERERFVC